MLSNGLDSIFVLFSLLEFCAAVAAVTFGCAAVQQHNYTRMVRGDGPCAGGSLRITPKMGFLSPFLLPQAM